MITLAVKPERVDEVHVIVLCPLCGKKHYHGSARGNYAGTRTFHCKKLVRGMEIEILEHPEAETEEFKERFRK